MRRNTRKIYVGNVAIGGDEPVSIQSMTNTPTDDVKATLNQIEALHQAGCQIVRVAVPDRKAVEAIDEITKNSPIPVIADIHFDYRLALECINRGIAGLRLNPGNIGGIDRVRAVAKAAARADVPIRIGVNGGSLDKNLIAKHGGLCADAMVESAMEQIKCLEDMNFHNIKISLKSSNVPMMYEAYSKLAQLVDYPFHIGVTEAGTPYRGSIKSAVGIGALLTAGLGDTMRVSLAGDPIAEIPVAKEILRAVGMCDSGVTYIVCPTCGRTKIDLSQIASEVEKEVDKLNITRPLTVAVMGCIVNGPGEASHADVGIAGGIGTGMLFKHGKEVGRYKSDELVEKLLELIKELLQEEK